MKPLVVAVVALTANVAAGDPLDDSGLGGAATPFARGAAAIHDDPANLARGDSVELMIGWHYAADRLVINASSAPLPGSHGSALALAIPVAIGKSRIAGGAALYLPDSYLARIDVAPADRPSYIRFASATQRAAVEPVLAIARGEWAFAIGASLLADARSRQLAFDVGVVGGDKQVSSAIDVALPLRAAPLLGVSWRALPWLELSATLRGELSLDLALAAVADVNVPNVVTGEALVHLRSVSHFTPLRVAIAGRADVRPDLAVMVRASYERWSALSSGVGALGVTLALDIAPTLVEAQPIAADFHDIVELRAALEWRQRCNRWRAGLGYLPSPVPPQAGLTNFVDGTRTLLAVGLGRELPPNRWLARPIELAIATTWQHVFRSVSRKDPAIAPGAIVTAGGEIVGASASATVRF